MISCDIHYADSVHDPEKHTPERTQFRRDTIPNVRDPEWTRSEWNGFDPNGHNLEWTQSRMDQSRMATIPNRHDPKWTMFIRKQFRNLFHNKAV